MAKWRVTSSSEWEGEAFDEGDALIQADLAFSFMDEARAEELEESEEPQ